MSKEAVITAGSVSLQPRVPDSCLHTAPPKGTTLAPWRVAVHPFEAQVGGEDGCGASERPEAERCHPFPPQPPGMLGQSRGRVPLLDNVLRRGGEPACEFPLEGDEEPHHGGCMGSGEQGAGCIPSANHGFVPCNWKNAWTKEIRFLHVPPLLFFKGRGGCVVGGVSPLRELYSSLVGRVFIDFSSSCSPPPGQMVSLRLLLLNEFAGRKIQADKSWSLWCLFLLLSSPFKELRDRRGSGVGVGTGRQGRTGRK